MRSAYLDESIHEGHGLYVVAAVLASESLGQAAYDELCEVLPAARLPHWHSEDGPTRAKLVEAICSMPIEARVYGCRFDHARRQESARARGLRWFLSDLDSDLECVVVDQRQGSQDAIDRRILAQASGRPNWFAYRHAFASSEPLLWIADIVAGAVAASWTGRADYFVDLKEVLSVCERDWLL